MTIFIDNSLSSIYHRHIRIPRLEYVYPAFSSSTNVVATRCPTSYFYLSFGQKGHFLNPAKIVVTGKPKCQASKHLIKNICIHDVIVVFGHDVCEKIHEASVGEWLLWFL